MDDKIITSVSEEELVSGAVFNDDVVLNDEMIAELSFGLGDDEPEEVASSGESEEEDIALGAARYTNSSLVSYTRLSPNNSGQRTHSIDRITPHCVVGQCSVETLGSIFAPRSRQASSNYGIGPDGRVGMYVEEKNRSWCSSSSANDQRAITIECASDTKPPYAFRDNVYKRLIDLCVDICRRNGKKKLLWLGSKEKTLAYSPKSDEMVLTAHKWFADTACPGSWMYSREADLAKQVTARLGGSSSSTTTKPSTSTSFKVGDVVKITGSKYYDGKTTVPSWVKNKQWIVYSVSGSRVVLNRSTDGKSTIMSPFNASSLSKVSAAPTTKKKSNTQIAQEVIDGKWGNGETRKKRLTAAGYDYKTIQSIVNKLLS